MFGAKALLWNEMPLRKFNSSKTFYTGSKHNTNKSGEITIVGQLEHYYTDSRGHKSYRYFRIRFEDGTETVTTATCIHRGEVLNKNLPLLYGKGVVGYSNYDLYKDNAPTKEGALWQSMLARCYAFPRPKNFITYEECTVADRWLYFPNFCEDLPGIEGYDLWIQNPTGIHLDKDSKVPGNKVYSKDTCRFITHKENQARENKKQTLTGKTYKGIRLSDDYEEVFKNQREFGEKHNIPQYEVSRCVRGERDSYNGWIFTVLANEGAIR